MNKHALLPLVLLVPLAALPLAGCQKAGGAGALIPSQDVLAKNELAVFWEAPLPLDNETGEKVVRLERQPGRLYALTDRNRLLALDSFSGRFLWSVNLGRPGVPPSRLCQFSKVVHVALLDALISLSIEDGRLLAARRLARSPSTTLVTNGTHLYYGTNAGWFDAEGLLAGGDSWDYCSLAAILAAPACDDVNVYFANTAGKIFVSRLGGRHILREIPISGAVVADLKRTSGGLILVASRDYTLYALNPSSLVYAWTAITGDPLEKAPQPVGDRIYLIKKGGDLLALDERTGNTVWSVAGMRDFIAASAQTLFFRTQAGEIAALSPADGAMKFTLDPGAGNLIAANEVDGQIFGATPEGHVVALRETRIDYGDSGATTAPQAEPAPAPATPATAKETQKPAGGP